MIEKIIEFSCRNRFVVIIAFLAFTAYGIKVMRSTPVDAIPDLSENQVIVFTDWMGRSPKEIEDQITYPLSVNLQGLAGVKTIRSSSEFNFSMINIIFDDSVDFYFARTRVLERLTLANAFLPQGVTPYLAPDATALGQIFWYTLEGDNIDNGTMRSAQDWYVRYQLNAVPGVSQVSTVGGFPKEYQVDVNPERLRAYKVTLGEVYDAIMKSNSAVGGRVVQKGNSEYLIRGVGWLKNLEDVKNTVIMEHGGVPVRVGDVATVQFGSEFRRSVLERDGREVTGGVVMMRYGENPLEITQRIKQKIRDLQSGLPEGVRIVPFYDRTRLIEGAIGTVSGVLEHEIIVATIAILLILTHPRSVFVVIITLPLAILFAFVFMKWWGISSNIMSLSGVAISIGILVDQAIVMLENATHKLTKEFGDKRIQGDTTEIVVQACRQVGRPIFFSVVIMVLSFLPVFALEGQEGKLFHPLAYTKTFALIGTAILAVTLVPALIPLLIKGRLSREEDNWIIRSVIAMYKPVLGWLMNKPRTVVFMFVLLLAFGFYTSRKLGHEFMPPLDEGSIMDMPLSSPRISVTQSADDLKYRDTLLRELPEVESVGGKAGRADTPTDPAPLDMIETVVNLRPKEHWLKRMMTMDDAQAETIRYLNLAEKEGAQPNLKDEATRTAFIQSVAQGALDRFDDAVRPMIQRRLIEFEDGMVAESALYLIDRLDSQLKSVKGWANTWTAEQKSVLLQELTAKHAKRFRSYTLVTDIESFNLDAIKSLRKDGLISNTPPDPFTASEGGMFTKLSEAFGSTRKDYHEKTTEAYEKWRFEKAAAWVHKTNDEIFWPAMRLFEQGLHDELKKSISMQGTWQEKTDAPALEAQWKDRASDLGKRAFLWYKTKKDLVQELDTHVKLLGWGNIWTQPIINRVDMLATGVRTQIGVKVFGKDLNQVQQVSNEVSTVLKDIPGAVDVVADQTIGKGYIEIEVDRLRAARYGVNVGDIQDIIEVALGGKRITTTVEGRERYPVRLRYSRDSREDEESIKRIIVAASLSETGKGQEAAGMAMGVNSRIPSAMGQVRKNDIYLSDVANIRVIEGPVMIKSENGRLRSYVQLNVRERDIVGFVDEAMQIVKAKVKLPEGASIEWTGQYEHQVSSAKTLRIVFPAVIILIFVILYLTYNDLAHALLMMMAVPGALAGGVIFQTFFGYNFSVAVWVGYIACFGMATETGIIMLVYLRDAIHERGGLAGIKSLPELESAILIGAVHRLRPKLLTEGTAIIGLAPMLWAHGVGSEVMAPMAAPVLGGLLIADEVIDIFLPVLFFQVEKWRWLKLHEYKTWPRTFEAWLTHEKLPIEVKESV